MGRGGGRSKASSTGTLFESEAAFLPVNLNTSLIEFILSGRFESDYFSYCSNRLTDYTCRYWYDPNLSEDGKDADAYTYMSDNFANSQFTNSIETHLEMLLRFATPQNVPVSLTGGIGSQGWTKQPNESALLITDLIAFSLSAKEKVGSTLLIIVFLLSIFCNILSFNCLRRIADNGLYIAKVFAYLVLLQTIDLSIELIDVLVFCAQGVPLFTVMEFLGRWSCQTFSMGYSCIKHTEGLLISTIAVDVLIFNRSLRQHVKQYRAEWANNIFILIIATLATANSQFFWTFDLFHVDNRIPPSDAFRGDGGAFVEPSLYMCGFSSSWGLNHAFVSYIWPTIDHLIGDILPCILPMTAGMLALVKSRKLQTKTANRQLSVPYTKAIVEIMWILPVLFLLHGISTIPRMIFYITKYFLFSEKYLNRLGLIFHRENTKLSDKGSSIRTAIAKVISFRQIDPTVQTRLQELESSLQFVSPIFTLANSLIVICGFSESRQTIKKFLTFRLQSTIRRLHGSRSMNTKKVKQQSLKSKRINMNHMERVPSMEFSATTVNLPRRSLKSHVYIKTEDVEEVAI